MRFALINPNWSFEGSIYFGCREPHLPLEFGYTKALLQREGHKVLLLDAQLGDLDETGIAEILKRFQPDVTVVTTAPSYLFWRCPPPELAIPRRLIRAIHPFLETIVAVGPHGSTTPSAALAKLGADAVVVGECEEIIPRLAGAWNALPSLVTQVAADTRRHASDMTSLPPLEWPEAMIAAHDHHHHRFDHPFNGPGAEMEASRGCPYHCTFCAKDNFRDAYRRRPLDVILAELDGLIRHGVKYVYFIDEIFLPRPDLLQALASRRIRIGIQTRIDLWNRRMLDLLADAGCVSIEAGVESLTPEGRDSLDKKCRMSTGDLSDLLIYAKRRIAFVQANLIKTELDDPAATRQWRSEMRSHGVWANDPVPLFPYPGSPDYARRWGLPDDRAWERAHNYYLSQYSGFSEIQDERPLPLEQLESA
ncbi:MAG: TIGR04295 family B12-binding domain-containing radical SAM protein [Acidobacteriia bacterium]|nr:TIGR04295 family B12-binding domain-containing radical SAM protein [Terriglobia bacterium]